MSVAFVAQPWWVNGAVLIPIAAYLFWRRHPLKITASQLTVLGLFALAFGFLEATVVVYLRAANGLLPGYPATLSAIGAPVPQLQLLQQVPPSLLRLESFREAATMLMLLSIALLIAGKSRDRAAAFLWAFAIWDITYYASLHTVVHWPQSLTDLDVLFLIPEPWFAPVWFPVLVSALTLLAILLTRVAPAKSRHPANSIANVKNPQGSPDSLAAPE